MAWNTPSTWTAGSVLTAAQLNAQLRDNMKAIGDPWTPYTPSWTAITTNPTIGNGTLTGAYMQAGQLVHFRIALTIGSTTNTGSGGYAFSLPVATALPSTSCMGGGGVCFDTSAAARRFRFLYVTDASRIRLMDADGAIVATNVPFTWATGDTLHIAGSYEAA
ncbi:hypothetical protein [Nocardioides sp. J54]|uniref:hypothetical protein n=1 Tax=Nocardioides sp. J54 TaxID=935866 RepID=UPI0004B8F99D|nr:hypothetical protein [Nocardioides sp. J54]